MKALFYLQIGFKTLSFLKFFCVVVFTQDLQFKKNYSSQPIIMIAVRHNSSGDNLLSKYISLTAWIEVFCHTFSSIPQMLYRKCPRQKLSAAARTLRHASRGHFYNQLHKSVSNWLLPSEALQDHINKQLEGVKFPVLRLSFSLAKCGRLRVMFLKRLVVYEATYKTQPQVKKEPWPNARWLKK